MKHQQAATGTSPAVHARRRAPASKQRDDAAVPSPADDSEARDSFIRDTAYSFYEARGRIDGYDLEDWLRAEAQAIEAFGERADTAARQSSEP